MEIDQETINKISKEISKEILERIKDMSMIDGDDWDGFWEQTKTRNIPKTDKELVKELEAQLNPPKPRSVVEISLDHIADFEEYEGDEGDEMCDTCEAEDIDDDTWEVDFYDEDED